MLVLTATLTSTIGIGSARAAELSAVNEAEFTAGFEAVEGLSPMVLKAQVLLDRASASPGVIDGIYGDNVAKAISAFEEVHDLPVDGKLDEEVWAALTGDDPQEALIDYEVT